MTAGELAARRTASALDAPAAMRRRVRLPDSALTHEILMGAQDNLTNVLAVMLGVAIGAGRSELVALAGASAALAEAISMGGVLYSATRATELSAARAAGEASTRHPGLRPVASGVVTTLAALVAGALPLLPFTVFPLAAAVGVSVVLSLVALFVLGSWTGHASGVVWWRDGARLLIVGSAAAVAAAAVGSLLRVG